MKALAMVAVFAILAGGGGALAQPAFADHSESIVDIPTGSGACIDTNECYVPTDVRIDVGGEITWINNDIVSHSIEVSVHLILFVKPSTFPLSVGD